MSGVAQSVISAPSNRTRPAEACQSPMIVRKVVVLPAPLRPSSMVSPPRGTASSTPCKIWYGPMWVLTLSSCSSGAASDIGDTKIGFLHHRRGDHAGGLAVGHQLAVVQHDDAVGERAHHVHLVFDQQNGPVAARLDLVDKIEDHRHLVNAHAGGWLVEHEDGRAQRQKNRNLELALIAVRQ